MMKPTDTKLQRINATSLGDSAYLEIRKNILKGDFAPGDRLVIDAIARDLGVSLGPVREALARLSSERLVSFERNKGYRVTDMPSPEDVGVWQEARLVMECGAVELAAGRATAADIAELERINDTIRSRDFGPGHRPVMDFMSLNAEFHAKIFQIVGNALLNRLYHDLSYGPQVSRRLTKDGVDDKDDIVAEHDRIIKAIARGDSAGASAAMRRHIVDALERSFVRARAAP